MYVYIYIYMYTHDMYTSRIYVYLYIYIMHICITYISSCSHAVLQNVHKHWQTSPPQSCWNKTRLKRFGVCCRACTWEDKSDITHLFPSIFISTKLPQLSKNQFPENVVFHQCIFNRHPYSVQTSCNMQASGKYWNHISYFVRRRYLSKTNLFTIGRIFHMNSRLNSLLPRYFQYDGLAQTSVFPYPLLPRHPSTSMQI